MLSGKCYSCDRDIWSDDKPQRYMVDGECNDCVGQGPCEDCSETAYDKLNDRRDACANNCGRGDPAEGVRVCDDCLGLVDCKICHRVHTVDPLAKPHTSLRVPGYLWSPWQSIVNRNANSNTWRPSEEEEDWHTNSNKSDSDFAEEFKNMVRFERARKLGDPLTLIISGRSSQQPGCTVLSRRVD